jgi:ABC-type multidrug transport system permease subunit
MLDSSRKLLDTIIQIMQIGFKELTARSLTGEYRRDGVKYFSRTLSILRACWTSIAVYLSLILAPLKLYFGYILCILSPLLL